MREKWGKKVLSQPSGQSTGSCSTNQLLLLFLNPRRGLKYCGDERRGGSWRFLGRWMGRKEIIPAGWARESTLLAAQLQQPKQVTKLDKGDGGLQAALRNVVLPLPPRLSTHSSSQHRKWAAVCCFFALSSTKTPH